MLGYLHIQISQSLWIKYNASKLLYHYKNVAHDQEMVFANQALYTAFTYTTFLTKKSYESQRGLEKQLNFALHKQMKNKEKYILWYARHSSLKIEYLCLKCEK